MSRPPLEVADVFRLHGEQYRSKHKGLATVQYRAMRAIERCRTAALGGHVSECDRCGHRVISYNSCRNRNCPKCQSSAAKRWLEKRTEEVLPVPYFHVVFTVPQQIAKIALGNQKAIYRILFRCVCQTLLEIAADRRHLGGEIGFLAILHTWGQNLEYHPHIHCVIPGVVLRADGKCKRTRERFFLAVAVLSKLFRGKFLAGLNQAFRAGKLRFTGKLADISSEAAFRAFLKPLYLKNWVVYCKAPFGGPEAVLSYLGRYTHRIAISNHRLVSLDHGVVRFRWRDYRDGSKNKILALKAEEWIRRFLMHIVPSRFVRIRYYGFLSNRRRAASLAMCREQLSLLSDDQRQTKIIKPEGFATSDVCPNCKKGKLIIIEVFDSDARWNTS
jgi:hypothetical protein